MARAIGINHVALEVDDIDEALAWYGRLFGFELRGRVGEHLAFIDLGDQFLALSSPRTGGSDAERHFGLVVDDVTSVRVAAAVAGARILPGKGLTFYDPWGNRIEAVGYRDVQYTKAGPVLAAMGVAEIGKTDAARAELAAKGLGTDPHMPPPALPLRGRCVCGAIRFEIHAPLESASWCHCTRCQHRTGGAASAQARIPEGALRFTRGKKLVKAYTPPEPGWAKLFCPECGGHLFSRPRHAAEPTTVRLGAMNGDPGIRPGVHRRVETAAAWQPIPDDGLPRYTSDELPPA